jgi:hypothetical protein
MTPVKPIAMLFTGLCPYCNRLADVVWRDGRYVWSMHPLTKTLCYNSAMAWHNKGDK